MKQRGQTLVEFALLLPLFVLFLLGTMYVGFLFSDYMSYDNMARMAAREAAITSELFVQRPGTAVRIYDREYTHDHQSV